jgi:NAD(P)-dependent dehydrogenase (short-subunit alcohol dehydrogenase family)
MVGQPFWTLPLERISECLEVGPRSNYVTTALAAPIMIAQRSGLVVKHLLARLRGLLLATPYGVGKAAIEKVTHDTALELREFGIAVVSLWPGLVLTERIAALAAPGPDGRPQLLGLDLDVGESPRFSGARDRGALHRPRPVEAHRGSFFASRLAREYGFTDVAGNLPPEVRLLVDHLGEQNVPPYWRMVERFGRGFRRG